MSEPSVQHPWLRRLRAPPAAYVEAVLGVAAVTAIFWPNRVYLRENVDTMYILVVVLAGTRGGLGPAIFASFLSFACWQLIVGPWSPEAIPALRALVSLVVFFAVAVLTGQVAAGGRQRALEAQAREQETSALYELSLAVASQTDLGHLLHLLAQRVVQACRVEHCSFWQAEVPGSALRLAQAGTKTKEELVGDDGRIKLPLVAEGQVLGVMIAAPLVPPELLSIAEKRLLQGVANFAAVALHREELAREAGEARANLEAERLKASLLSSVSHDLRTPLSSIKASATSLASDDVALDEETRGALVRSVVKNADRLNQLVGNLLDISRLEAGAWQPLKETYPVMEILGSVLGRLDEPEAARVRVHVPDNLPLISVDGLQIEQVLWNLLENALKYSPPESPFDLDIRADGSVLTVSVRDRGPGIPEGEETAIFRKFYRAHSRTEGGPPGLGVGLAICKAAVEAHGGRIWASNAPDGGAVLSFTLPLADETPASTQVNGGDPAKNPTR